MTRAPQSLSAEGAQPLPEGEAEQLDMIVYRYRLMVPGSKGTMQVETHSPQPQEAVSGKGNLQTRVSEASSTVV